MGKENPAESLTKPSWMTGQHLKLMCHYSKCVLCNPHFEIILSLYGNPLLCRESKNIFACPILLLCMPSTIILHAQHCYFACPALLFCMPSTTFLHAQHCYFAYWLSQFFNPNPHGMFWTKVIYDLASSEPYSLSSLNSKNLKKILKCPKRSW